MGIIEFEEKGEPYHETRLRLVTDNLCALLLATCHFNCIVTNLEEMIRNQLSPVFQPIASEQYYESDG